MDFTTERIVTTYDAEAYPGEGIERARWNDDPADDSFQIMGEEFERVEAEALWDILGQALWVESVAKTA